MHWIIDLLSREPRTAAPDAEPAPRESGAAALANRCPVCDAAPDVGCTTAPYSLGTRRPLRKPHTARAGAAPRGFAAMPPERRREIASEGGRTAHEKGTAHEFTTEEAQAAGRKGGEKVAANREHMAEIGRRGGKSLVGRLGADHMAEIGRRGGETVSKDRRRMAEIGRKGGLAGKGRAA